MTEDEEKYIRNLKYNAFMGTIAVCVIYGIIAILMILYINLTESGKTLYSDLKPFALTFIFGTLLIIIVTTTMVLYWEPEQAAKLKINDVLQNPYSCPDYYVLKQSGVDESNMVCNMSANFKGNTTVLTDKVDFLNYKSNELYEYKCTNDTNIIETATIDTNNAAVYAPAGTNSLYKSAVGTRAVPLNTDTDAFDALGTDTDSKSLTDKLNYGDNIKGYAAFAMMYGGVEDVGGVANLKIADSTATDTDANKFKVECGKVYPEYLAYLDAKEFIDNDEKGPKNLHRCEWAKKCGVPWSSAGC
jgi:hypothetical protein